MNQRGKTPRLAVPSGQRWNCGTVEERKSKFLWISIERQIL